jgi:hypothetical protein
MSNVYTANKMRKMENNMIEFTVSSAISSAFYEMKFEQIKRIMIKSASIFDDMEEFQATNPVYHCMVSTMAVGILENLNITEDLFSDISDMEYANKFSKRLKRLNRSVGTHPEDVQDAAMKMFEKFGEGDIESVSDIVPDEGDALLDTLELIEAVSDFIGPQLSAEWIKEPGVFSSYFEISISCRGNQYAVSGKKNFLTEHYALEINGDSGHGTSEREVSEREGTEMVLTRGYLPLGTEENFDVVTIEFCPWRNITLSCENEEVELKHV